jgi:hypothetical protein
MVEAIPRVYRRQHRRQCHPPPSTRIETGFRDFTTRKRFPRNRIKPPDLYSSSAAAAKPPPETRSPPPPRERKDLEGFHGRSQPPELHISIRRQGFSWSLIPLCQALDGDPTRTLKDSREFQCNREIERSLAVDRGLVYCLGICFGCIAIQISDRNEWLQPSPLISTCQLTQ